MATADTDRVANETIERLAQCLKLSERASFKSACKSRDIRTLDMTAQQFFSTWTTSLMGDDLQRLNELAVRPDISSHVKILCIEDDTRKYDPWNVSEPPAPGSTNLWPWDELGIVNSALPGMKVLNNMLSEHKLKPTIIKIQEYSMSDANSLVFPGALSHHRTGAIQTVTAIARNILGDTNLTIISLMLDKKNVDLSPDSWVFLPRDESVAISNPDVREMILELSLQDKGKDFSELRTVRLSYIVEPWWLEQIFSQAVMLEELELVSSNALDTVVPTICAISQLKKLNLSHLSVRAETILRLIATCKNQLITISFRCITLTNESTWSLLLSALGNECRNLTSFHITVPREEKNTSTSGKAINFFGMMKDAVAEQEGERLKIEERGSAENRRCNRVYYDGPHAAKVLRCLATYAA
ncbi:hypothetical protein M438DRAFT_292640 [Aureobasidium pullulans EXF-150]|uniref:RNI-like protein n=1 Tax=Aureobasidium pullulans EXF-150 TaxID=1043002 RepID=A0A074XWK1_AURPU|nr:uncharacterized protein M438DRAFT_292640 [Aureobasidium pullulans EXF-150]KEQ86287.1 hypothetical protein M438DRAFT_292640 [Aureobasidium pullulans EXF-150]